MKRIVLFAFVWIAMLLVIVACGKGETPSAGDNQQPAGTEAGNENKNEVPELKISTDPVTLKVRIVNSITEAEVERLWIEPLKAKHPNITLEITRGGNATTMIQEVATGNIPDIVYYSAYIQDILDIDLPLDLTDLMKKHQMTLDTFSPEIVGALRSFGPKGEIYGIPFSQNAFLMLYNKSLFDRFGQAYPKDGLTWDETAEIARRMSRVVDGVQYRGVDPLIAGGIHRLGFPMSIHYVDAKTNKAFMDPRWNRIFEMAMNIFSIPGNKPEKIVNNQAMDDFVKNQTIALWPAYNVHMNNQIAGLSKMEWDIAQFPSYPDYPNVGIMVDPQQFVVAKTTKYPDQVMQALKVFISDPVQTNFARLGKIPAIISSDVMKEFGAEVEAYKGKNIAAMFKSKSAPFAPTHQYDMHVRNEITAAFGKVFAGTADINTALREAEEAANQKIATEMTAR